MTMRPRILVTNWVHEATLQQLSLLGDVDANESRAPWPRDEVMRRAEKADAILAFMTAASTRPFSHVASGCAWSPAR
jgi:phosphonate dehydrogenase